LVVARSRFMRIAGPMPNQEGVVHVKAERMKPLEISRIEVRSRNFH